MVGIRKSIAMMMIVTIAASVLAGCSGTNEKNKKIEELKKTTTDSFSSIYVDVDVANVDIIPEADEYAIEYHIINQDVDYSVKDGTLTLNADGGKSVTVSSDDQSYVKIYVPEGSEFTDVNYEGDVGDVHIEKIKVDDMEIATEVGNAIISDVEVNKKLGIETEVGNIELALANPECSYKITVDVAKVVINGTEFSDFDFEKTYTSESGPQVNLSTETGKINFSYK